MVPTFDLPFNDFNVVEFNKVFGALSTTGAVGTISINPIVGVQGPSAKSKVFGT